MKQFIHGMDISSMDEVVRLGGKFYDEGEEKDLIDILVSYGINYVRLRLWVDPYTEDGVPYGAGTNDLDTTIRMVKKIKAAGLKYLLDFHYSDFWTDPGKQIKPKAWKDYKEEKLENEVFQYTLNTLKILERQDILPDMVQVGNEITNGFLWPEGEKPNYDMMAKLINAGIRGVRGVDRAIPIMLHLDHGDDKELYEDWFDNYMKRGDDFQIIGLSYYPVWNGKLKGLIDNMNSLAKRYGKEMIVAEVSHPFTMADYATYEGLEPEKRKGYATKPELVEKMEYPSTIEGQYAFMKNFIEGLESVTENLGIGYFYWEPAWLPVRGSGWATKESLLYINDPGPCGNEWANQALFDYYGNALPTWKVIKKYAMKNSIEN